jgi:hypothetical protein
MDNDNKRLRSLLWRVFWQFGCALLILRSTMYVINDQDDEEKRLNSLGLSRADLRPAAPKVNPNPGLMTYHYEPISPFEYHERKEKEAIRVLEEKVAAKKASVPSTSSQSQPTSS